MFLWAAYMFCAHVKSIRCLRQSLFAFTKAVSCLGAGAAKIVFNLIDLRKANNAGKEN